MHLTCRQHLDADGCFEGSAALGDAQQQSAAVRYPAPRMEASPSKRSLPRSGRMEKLTIESTKTMAHQVRKRRIPFICSTGLKNGKHRIKIPAVHVATVFERAKSSSSFTKFRFGLNCTRSGHKKAGPCGPALQEQAIKYFLKHTALLAHQCNGGMTVHRAQAGMGEGVSGAYQFDQCVLHFHAAGVSRSAEHCFH